MRLDFAARRADLIREGALLAEACGARYLKLEYPGRRRRMRAA